MLMHEPLMSLLFASGGVGRAVAVVPVGQVSEADVVVMVDGGRVRGVFANPLRFSDEDFAKLSAFFDRCVAMLDQVWRDLFAEQVTDRTLLALSRVVAHKLGS